jgi:predicted alpha/beta-hydrolase family hydrolase
MTPNFLIDGPDKAKKSILLAHGAGAPMDSPAMTAIAKSLAEVGFRVARFEFDYMASRRTSSGRRPPPRAETLKPEYVAAIAALKARGPLIIGGKSMGCSASAIRSIRSASLRNCARPTSPSSGRRR